jgi:putative transposase
MPYIKLLVHAVWATKDRKPLMSLEHKRIICQHIRENAVKKNIHLLNVNGHHEHLHALISLTAEQDVSNVINLIKGESSFWANRNLRLKEKFGWQDDYFAVSVSQSHFEVVNNYINNQEEHHKNKSFKDEYDEFIKNYKFD